VTLTLQRSGDPCDRRVVKEWVSLMISQMLGRRAAGALPDSRWLLQYYGDSFPELGMVVHG
jgi:hypothetical protein